MEALAAKIVTLVTAAIIGIASFFAPHPTTPSQLPAEQKIVPAATEQIAPTTPGPAEPKEEPQTPPVPTVPEPPRTKRPETEIHALYLTAYSAGNPAKIDWVIAQAQQGKINAVVIDIKDYSGKLSYASEVVLVKELGVWEPRIRDVRATVKKLHDAGLYVIARQTVFQDPALAERRPQWAVQNSKTGGIWRDHKGLSWLDATKKENWEYAVAIAKEAVKIGFDEINFDYIRFPSDGDMEALKYAHLGTRQRWEVMREFFEYVHGNLKDEPAYISADLFGFTTEKTDDMSIGQQIEDAIAYFDYVCPMVYPSHYPSGYMNFKNPAEHPYDVVKNAITKGEESIAVVPDRRGKIRPWLQDFNLGAIYTPQMVRDQIRASAEAGGYGWMLWNAKNNYQIDALTSVEKPQI